MRIIVALIVIFIPASLLSQQQVFDSIKNRIQIEKNDSEKVRLLVQLGNKSRYTDTLESLRCVNAIDSIAKITRNEYFVGQLHFLKGTLKLGTQNFAALDELEKSIEIYSKFPNNTRAQFSLAAAYHNTALVHFQNNDYTTSVEYGLRAEQIYLRINPRTTDLGTLYSNMSMAYSALNKPEEALAISKKGIDFARNSNDKMILTAAMFTYGGNLVQAKKGNSGLAVLDSAKKMAIEINNLNVAYMSDFMKANYYYNNKLYEEAIKLYMACLKIARDNNFAIGIGSNFINIAACEAELKKGKEAAAHLDSSAKYIDYTEPSEMKLEYFENYAQAYRLMKNYDKAFAYKDSVGAIKDSMYQRDNMRQMEFRQARYNYDTKQQEVLKLESDKKIQEIELSRKSGLNYLMGGGIVAMLLISSLGYRNYRNKQILQLHRINELETEKKLAATEAVLKGEEQERTRLAKDLHDGLGGLLSGVKYSLNTMKGNLIMTPENAQAFERSMDMLDSSIKEMRRVAHNMMPETLLKFGLDTALKDFCNDVSQSGAVKLTYQSFGLEFAAIDQMTAITIYRIVQELLNNTMKHAAAENVLVQVTKTDQTISVTVEDDGKGFDTSILKQSKGIGWSNILNRVEFLKGKLDVNSQPGKGTSVLVELSV